MTAATARALSSTPSSQEDVQEAATDDMRIADLCKAGADTLRLRILRLLKGDAMGVSELCDLLDVRQPALSHHLKLMSSAGLLDSQRDGNHIFYRRRELIPDGILGDLQRALLGAADALLLESDEIIRLRELQDRREENSRDFFRHNAARFRQQQDLIAGPERYGEPVRAVLDALPWKSRELALEIGPGDGWLLPLLSERFTRVLAVDRAEEMLERSRQTVEQEGLTNVELHLGDTGSDAITDLDADLAILNMVLHHTPEPARTLRETAAALAPGGSLLVTEICEHSQGWARESCGDLWLGFAPEQLSAWARDAGLEELAGDYLAQRNGFKLQVRLFTSTQTPAQKTA